MNKIQMMLKAQQIVEKLCTGCAHETYNCRVEEREGVNVRFNFTTKGFCKEEIEREECNVAEMRKRKNNE